MKGKILAISMILVLAACNGSRSSSCNDSEEEAKDSIPPLGFLTDTLSLESGIIKKGETFIGLLNRLGMDSESAYQLYLQCDSIFDVKKLRAGNSFDAYYSLDSLKHELSHLVYNVDKVNMTVFDCTPAYAVRKVEKAVEHIVKEIDVKIESSLWNDMLSEGASPLLISKLSDIYAWTVDFFGLQKEDRFRAIYSESLCEGDIISVDTVYFATFSREGKNLYAVMLDQGDGGNIYWNEKGESMRKAFLKAPLKFNRISSGFSYNRKHPVTGKVQAHTAVDYAAPTGTPVMSIGDGTVISVGYAGGGGNTVKIRHNSVYTTAYLHLSRYAKGLHTGQRVSQGEVIGYVGMTGTATGPHLDFRVWMNGSPINPLKMESPSEEPIKEENRQKLDSVFKYYSQHWENGN